MNSKKTLLYVLIGVILSGVVFGGIFYFTVLRTQPEAKEPVTYEYTFSTFTTNLSAQKTFFKGELVVETTDKALLEQFPLKNSEIRDKIIQILIAKKAEDILDSQGQIALRNEIKALISKVMNTEQITNVYFIDYIVQ